MAEPPSDDPYIGQVLADRYAISARIGSGGMGTVYEGRHQLIGRRVAVKILHRQLAANPQAVKRFMNEARAAGMLGHPHIIEPTDMGRTADGAPFLVLELLEGHNLEQVAQRAGPLPIGRAVRIVQQVCSALAAAHAQGIVHRDLKPENIFLTPRGGQVDFVKVLDFGISKMPVGYLPTGSLGPPGPGQTVRTGEPEADGISSTRTGVLMGTPHYLSPEQAADASTVDLRTDVYALGVILYRLLAGRVPFNAVSVPELVAKIVRDPPPALDLVRGDIPAELDAAIFRAMAKRREERFADMPALDAALAPFAAHDVAPELRAGLFVVRQGTIDAHAATASTISTEPPTPPPPRQPGTPSPTPTPPEPTPDATLTSPPHTQAAAPPTPAPPPPEVRRPSRRFRGPAALGLVLALGGAIAWWAGSSAATPGIASVTSDAATTQAVLDAATDVVEAADAQIERAAADAAVVRRDRPPIRATASAPDAGRMVAPAAPTAADDAKPPAAPPPRPDEDGIYQGPHGDIPDQLP